MARYIMDRRAGDNKYLHRDFHKTADCGLKYVGDVYGDDGVLEYITDYTLSFYKPLIQDMKDRGVVALKENLEKIYLAEEALDALNLEIKNETLYVEIKYCPALAYFKSENYTPCKWYYHTNTTIYDIIARGSGYNFNLISYDEVTGKAQWTVGGKK